MSDMCTDNHMNDYSSFEEKSEKKAMGNDSELKKEV